MGVAQVAAAQLRPLVVQLLLLVQIKRAKVRVPLQQHHQRLRNAPSQLRPRLVPQHQQLAGQLLFGQLDQLTQPQLEKKPVVWKRHNQPQTAYALLAPLKVGEAAQKLQSNDQPLKVHHPETPQVAPAALLAQLRRVSKQKLLHQTQRKPKDQLHQLLHSLVVPLGRG